MGNRQEVPSAKRAFVLTLCFSIISTVFCAYQLLQIPADAKNAYLFGLSKERLLMTGIFSVFLIILILCLLFRDKAVSFLTSYKKGRSIFCPAALISLFFLLIPDYRFGRNSAVFIRLRPFILWLFLVSAAFTLFYIYIQNHFSAVKETFHNLRQYKKYIFASLAVILIGVAFIELTGLGKTVESSLWNKNGIPLQSIQLFLSLIAFAILKHYGLLERIGKERVFLNFLLIWAVSALIWSFAPKQNHFFAPGPYEPNQAFYPYSDAAGYDLPAQTALNGWGFSFGASILKPSVVVVSFLTHLISDSDPTVSMMVQSAVYALLPAVIYLFGNAIGGRGCGYMAALFSILKEWNALNTTSVSTIHSRLIMSEFLTQILFAILCFAVFRWIQRRGKEILYAIIAGGVVTIGFFTRYNFAAFLPASLLPVFIAYRKDFRKIWKPLFFFFLSILTAALPYAYRESKLSWNIFNELEYTVRYVFIRQRIEGKEPLTFDEYLEIILQRKLGMTMDEFHQIVREVSELTEDPAMNDFYGFLSDIEGRLSGPEQINFNTGQITQEFSNNISNKNLSSIESIINHSIHNFVSSFLTLPMEWTFQDLDHLYTQDEDGLWRDSWDGSFSSRQWISVCIWIILGSVTAAVLIKNHGLAGFSVIYFWFVYAFSIGISRSSGGRYIVPINWIPMLLLSFCCTLLLNKGKMPFQTVSERIKLPVWQPICAAAVFVMFFGSMVIFEKVLPAKDTSSPDGDLNLLKNRLSDRTEIDWDLVSEQIEGGVMNISHGVSLYPRFYYYQMGEHTSNGVLMTKDYSRIIFSGINKDKTGPAFHEYLMPHKELINVFPQDSIYRALSCTTEYGYEDVLAVTIDTPAGKSYTYLRDPLPEFSCPVPEPVCLSIENCY